MQCIVEGRLGEARGRSRQINSPTVRAGLLFNGGSLCPAGVRAVSRTDSSKAEDLGLGFEEKVSMEMLPEDHSYRPKARARLAARSSRDRWALTCCLVLLPILAGLTTYLLIGQLRAQGEACVSQVSKTSRCPEESGDPLGCQVAVATLDRALASIQRTPFLPSSSMRGRWRTGAAEKPSWVLLIISRE